MRSVPTGSFERLTSPEALWAAWTRSREGRRRRPELAHFDFDAELRILNLSRALRDGSYQPGKLRLLRIFDPKPRCVAVAPVVDRIVHQALIGELGPCYARSFIDQSYGCLTDRGSYRALWALVGGMRRYGYRVSLDVRSFFPSVDRARLTLLWFYRLTDPQTRALITAGLDTAEQVYREPWVRQLLKLPAEHEPGRGLLVGSYLSHFSAALYLDGLDHFVKRELKVEGYLRYMDDLVLLGDDKARLREARDAVAAWLLEHRSLVLGEPDAIIRSTAHPLRWLGHRVSREGVEPTKKLLRNLPARVRRAAHKGPLAVERLLISYTRLLQAPG